MHHNFSHLIYNLNTNRKALIQIWNNIFMFQRNMASNKLILLKSQPRNSFNLERHILHGMFRGAGSWCSPCVQLPHSFKLELPHRWHCKGAQDLFKRQQLLKQAGDSKRHFCKISSCKRWSSYALPYTPSVMVSSPWMQRSRIIWLYSDSDVQGGEGR